jgi:hypothetical protein
MFTPVLWSRALACSLICSAVMASALSFAATPPALNGFPFTDEDLNYSVAWPGGANLGEGHLHAKHSGADWNFTLTLDARIPGFAVKDTYRSDTVGDLCSASFDRSTTHGSHVIKEKQTIDRDRSTATRTGSVEIPTLSPISFTPGARWARGESPPRSQSCSAASLTFVRITWVRR